MAPPPGLPPSVEEEAFESGRSESDDESIVESDAISLDIPLVVVPPPPPLSAMSAQTQARLAKGPPALPHPPSFMWRGDSSGEVLTADETPTSAHSIAPNSEMKADAARVSDTLGAQAQAVAMAMVQAQAEAQAQAQAWQLRKASLAGRVSVPSTPRAERQTPSPVEIIFTVKRGKQGLGLQITDDNEVANVEEGSFAAKAGIRQGDLVVALNGTRLQGEPVVKFIALFPNAPKYELTVLRQGGLRAIVEESSRSTRSSGFLWSLSARSSRASTASLASSASGRRRKQQLSLQIDRPLGCGPLGIYLNDANVVVQIAADSPARGHLRVRDRVVAVDGVKLRKRRVNQVMRAQPSHIFTVERAESSPTRTGDATLHSLTHAHALSHAHAHAHAHVPPSPRRLSDEAQTPRPEPPSFDHNLDLYPNLTPQLMQAVV